MTSRACAGLPGPCSNSASKASIRAAQLRIAPFLGMGGMMEAAGGVENRPRGGFDVGDLESALLHAVGQDMRDLIGQASLCAFTALQASRASVR